MTRSPRELAQQKIQQRKQQEQLFGDLLTVIDTLDRATDHWQKAQFTAQVKANKPIETSQIALPSSSSPPPLVQWLKRWLATFTPAGNVEKNRVANNASSISPAATQDGQNALTETITSALDGNQMIRTSLLEILAKHQVSPIPAQGQPFNPETMKALGQQSDDSVPPNTVIQEVIRGYFWNDKVLREAQVIVSQHQNRGI